MKAEYDKLLAAINGGKIDDIQRLVDGGLDLNRPCDDGATCLYVAILNGDHALVRFLLDHGANPNFLADEPAASMYAPKPLELALQARFLMDWEKFDSIVKTLLESGATDFNGNTESPEKRAAVRQKAREHGLNKSA